MLNPNGQCDCPAGMSFDTNGHCVATTNCPANQVLYPNGQCDCPAGMSPNPNGHCEASSECPATQELNAAGHCDCPTGMYMKTDGVCMPVGDGTCGPTEYFNPASLQCECE